MDTNNLHLVIRFSDTMFDVGDVISIHNEVVKKQGAVWFGKLGGTLSLSRIELLNKQIAQKIPTFIYLVKGNRKKSTPYKANILALSRDFPKKEKELIPAYYAEKKLLKYMNAWVKIGHIEQVEIADLKNLKTINSIFPLEETLSRSQSGYFLVHESKSIF
jgi:calcineurin-like phosphoesterase family protein